MKTSRPNPAVSLSNIISPFFPGPGLAIATFAFLTLFSWQKWSNIIVDYGQEAYVPWAINEGMVLYKDINYLHGPLSSYLHALIFKIFGPGILHLAIFNLLLIALLAWIIYKLVREASDPETGSMASLMFLAVFAFAQYKGWESLNFVCPYVYALTHGLILGFGALWLFTRYIAHPTSLKLLGLGFLTGLTYLTKLEAFVATASALMLGLLIHGLQHHSSLRSFVRRFFLLLAGIIIPVIPCVLYFSLHMPFNEVLMALNPWILAFNPDVRNLPYYLYISGANERESNLIKMALCTVVWVGLTGGGLAINRFLARREWNTKPVALGGAAALAVAWFVFYDHIPWDDASRAFPVFMMVLGGFYLYRVFGPGRKEPLNREEMILFTMSIFAFIFLIKIIWKAQLIHLGFALTLPAALVVLVFLLHRLPLFAERTCGSATAYRLGALALTFMFIGVASHKSIHYYQAKVFPVGEGVDRIFTFPPTAFRGPQPQTQGMMVSYILEYMTQEFKPEDTLVTLPDSMMFNYLMRKKFTTRDTIYNPLTWIILGEKPVLDRLRAASPTYILFIDYDFEWFGRYRYFGKDFGLLLNGWIRDHYTVVKQVGPAPFNGQGFGIQLLKMNSN